MYIWAHWSRDFGCINRVFGSVFLVARRWACCRSYLGGCVFCGALVGKFVLEGIFICLRIFICLLLFLPMCFEGSHVGKCGSVFLCLTFLFSYVSLDSGLRVRLFKLFCEGITKSFLVSNPDNNVKSIKNVQIYTFKCMIVLW